jgi:hypothetical protein
LWAVLAAKLCVFIFTDSKLTVCTLTTLCNNFIPKKTLLPHWGLEKPPASLQMTSISSHYPVTYRKYFSR